MDKFDSDFDFFWDKINSNENFTFARYADGEILLMKGLTVGSNTQAYNVDKWSSGNGISKVGKELLNSMNHQEDNYYYAISSKTDNPSDYSFLVNNIKNTQNLTFVNLWINNNYNRSKEKYQSLKRPVNMICNENAKIENFPFPIKSLTYFPNDCINFWEKNSDKYLRDLYEKFSNVEDNLFFISCGPVSEIIIDYLYRAFPNNTYIDVGSSIDEFVHGKKTRPYMFDNTIYSKMKSYFD